MFRAASEPQITELVPHRSPARSRRRLLAAPLVALAIGCAKSGGTRAGPGEISEGYDPYTGTPRLKVEYVIEPKTHPDISRSASAYKNQIALAFVRAPEFGDAIVLQARHECSYDLGGRRVECLRFACSAKSQQVKAFGMLDGAPAQLPRFDCRGYGQGAADYSASFTRRAVHQIAAASQLWLKLPTGEFGLNRTQLQRLRQFMAEVEGPARGGPTGVDLRR